MLKNTSVSEIVEAIRAVYHNKVFVPDEIEKALKLKQKYFDESDEFVNAVSLTKREKEVLEYISRGYRSEDIANALKLKKDTVNEYRDKLIKKMNAKNTAELIRNAFQAGLL
ncbi:helix-turn-helix transcriptional regulator [Emticicia fluvialis]|uniref:helix-turn-helix transcriptional regulator n=1 Tax=Emticicia fluvialis TaxID=2974474 RepID=UPI002165366D|nr:LuxR C-terminal-related transcriptional regulator [Emticicia fluvialis]